MCNLTIGNKEVDKVHEKFAARFKFVEVDITPKNRVETIGKIIGTQKESVMLCFSHTHSAPN